MSCKIETKTYTCGIDPGFNGYAVILGGNTIIDICEYPRKTNDNNAILKEIKEKRDKNDYIYFSNIFNKNFKKFLVSIGHLRCSHPLSYYSQ